MLNKIEKLHGNKRPSKRVGRGGGSGKGFHTVGKGQKGQKARAGNSIPTGFEGGQVPLFKKLPRFGGFKNPTTKKIKGISMSVLNKFEDGTQVEPKTLVEKKILVSLPKHGVKILNTGDTERKLTLKGFKYSKSAREKLEKSGVTILE